MKQAVLVVSFGTSYNDNRKKTIEAIERSIAEQFPEYEFRRAFTSKVILKILKERDNIEIDNVMEAMERLKEDGFTRVVVQPTHVMSGEEYDGMMEAIRPYESVIGEIVCGAPLLTSPSDYRRLITIMAEDTKEYDIEGTEIIFMGHGTEHEANEVYEKLADEFEHAGYTRYHIGTVEAKPDLEDMIKEVKSTASKRILLQPLMIVAGDHANNDMAGDKDSWKCRLEAEGYEVAARLKGLGELPGIRSMFVDHAREAEEKLKQSGDSSRI